MGWDDAPPTDAELGTSAASWDSTPPTKDELTTPEPERGLFGQVLDKPGSVGWDLVKGTPINLESEAEIHNEPGLLDTTVMDATAAQGLYGLGELGARLAGKAAGTALTDVVPAVSNVKIPLGIPNPIPNTENLVPSIGRVANNQTLKSMGGTMGQLVGMAKGREGRAALDKAAQYARDKGLADVFSTGIGREKNLEGLLDSTGQKIGALRQEAGAAPPGIEKRILADPTLDKYLGQGSASGGISGVDQALADIREQGGAVPTHKSLADAATYINEQAAGNRLYQPVNAETDVANILSRENNADIAQALGSNKAKQYTGLLEEQSRLHPLQHLSQRGELREAGGRSALATTGLIQKIADSYGYRMSAKIAAAIHDALAGRGLINVPARAAQSAARTVPAAVDDYLTRKYGENQ